VAFRQQPIRQMRSQKSRPARDHRNLLRCHVPLFLIRAENLCEKEVGSVARACLELRVLLRNAF
jgi:hypothetical protein